MSNSLQPLDPQQLRWQVDERALPFDSTEELEPLTGIVGQPIAHEALLFGLKTTAPAQNIFIRGLSGTGRMTLVRALLKDLNAPSRRAVDHCYVHNFSHPERPRLITLAGGQGRRFRRQMQEIAEFIRDRLDEALNSDPTGNQRKALQDRIERRVQKITAPLEKELKDNGMTLVRMQTGPVSQIVIFPLIMGKPVSPEELAALVERDQADEQDFERFKENSARYTEKLKKVAEQANREWHKGLEELSAFNEREGRRILGNLTEGVVARFAAPGVEDYLNEVIDDVVEKRLGGEVGELARPEQIYGVNVVSEQTQDDAAPAIVETTPSVTNLLGTVDPAWLGTSRVVSSYRGIRAGALVQADGGYLILEARDVLSEAGAWKLLMRSLRTGQVEIVPPELGWPYSAQSLKPEPIPVKVRVILLGDGGLFEQLTATDPDFADLFKLLADFDSDLERSDDNQRAYGAVVARLVDEEQLPHFDRSGVAALIEHGARIAARSGYLTARFGRLADIAREAAFLTTEDNSRRVSREHVEDAVRRTRFRASLPRKRFHQALEAGRIGLMVRGRAVGQINALGIMPAGPLTFGFPARITATVGAGSDGATDIEGLARLSGNIHTKGFQIAQGVLRWLLRPPYPLSFSASLAFEQSYGAIDGDSASAAEVLCLLSALGNTPLRQDLAITGAVDQHGRIQAVGAVNEKIEGFFEACQVLGITGEQGVIIPRVNAGDLMLRREVQRACIAGQFHVYPAENLHQAIQLLSGHPGGVMRDGRYPENSLLRRAQDRIAEFWRQSHPADHSA